MYLDWSSTNNDLSSSKVFASSNEITSFAPGIYPDKVEIIHRLQGNQRPVERETILGLPGPVDREPVRQLQVLELVLLVEDIENFLLDEVLTLLRVANSEVVRTGN